jgi:hypothetical protein
LNSSTNNKKIMTYLIHIDINSTNEYNYNRTYYPYINQHWNTYTIHNQSAC